MDHLGPDVPLHFTAFHPDYKMLDVAHTPHATLTRARDIALRHGLRYVYTGNVHDEAGQSTYCHACGARLIGRDWYRITAWQLTPRAPAPRAARPAPACSTRAPAPGASAACRCGWAALRRRSERSIDAIYRSSSSSALASFRSAVSKPSVNQP